MTDSESGGLRLNNGVLEVPALAAYMTAQYVLATEYDSARDHVLDGEGPIEDHVYYWAAHVYNACVVDAEQVDLALLRTDPAAYFAVPPVSDTGEE